MSLQTILLPSLLFLLITTTLPTSTLSTNNIEIEFQSGSIIPQHQQQQQQTPSTILSTLLHTIQNKLPTYTTNSNLNDDHTARTTVRTNRHRRRRRMRRRRHMLRKLSLSSHREEYDGENKCGCKPIDDLGDALDIDGVNGMIKVQILEKVDGGVDKGHEYYVGYVKDGYKGSGCEWKGKEVAMKVSCGVEFMIGRWYLVSYRNGGGSTPPPGVKERGVVVVSGCDYWKKWGELYNEDKKELYEKKSLCGY